MAPFKKEKKNKKMDAPHRKDSSDVPGLGPRQAMSRFDSPAASVHQRNLDIPFLHHPTEHQISTSPAESPNEELSIRGAALRNQAKNQQERELYLGGGSRDYSIGHVQARLEEEAATTQGAFIHPSRLGLITVLPQREQTTLESPGMSPGVMLQPGINPFRTSLGNHTSNHVSSSNHSHSNSNHSASNNNVTIIKKDKDANDEAILPPLVDAAAPDRSKIVVARQFLFQHELEAAGLGVERDVSGRLMGISLIEGVRRVLRM
jgi:hypothetical protein